MTIFLCLFALSVGAEDAPWEWVTPRPQGHSLLAAAVGDGVTVAVGELETVVTTADGVEWRNSHTGADYRLRDVVRANGLFVAVGGDYGFEFSPGAGAVLTSDNGFDWVERHITTNLTLTSVVWNGSSFVVVGSGDRVLLSPDGLSWTEQQIESSWWMEDIAWNGSLLVAVGRDWAGWGLGRPSFFTSENGEEWRVQNIECEYCDPRSIAALGNRFVVIGPAGKALVSDDGVSWIEAPYDASGSFDTIVSGGDRFLAIGYGMVGTSLDGFVWTIEGLRTESGVNGLAWLGAGYLAVGEDGFMMSSPGGSEWTQLSASSFGSVGSGEIIELATDGSTIVGVGEYARIITRRPGNEWVQLDSPATSGDLSGAIWNGSAFWAVGDSGILMSIDGIRWTQVLLDHEVRLFDIGWNGSVFVAVGRQSRLVGENVETRHVVLTSPDGHSWSFHYVDIDGNLLTVGWTGSEFVAAGSGPHYLTSADGTVWLRHTWDEDLEVRDMAWDGGRLVAVGGRFGVGGFILSTDDGLQWLELELPEDNVSSFNDVTWTGSHFVAVSRMSGDVIFSSSDGLTWSSETTGTGMWPFSVVADDRNLYVTGRGLQIIRRARPPEDSRPPRRPNRRVTPVERKTRETPQIRR